jgi:hypothetical protein
MGRAIVRPAVRFGFDDSAGGKAFLCPVDEYLADTIACYREDRARVKRAR